MKKIITLLTIPLFAFAQMQITAMEQVSETLKPDVLQGSLSFEEESKNSNEIKMHLNTIISEVKKFDPKSEMCRGGGYQLSPRYHYKDQKRDFIGYSGNLYFSCEFASIERYNQLNAAIDKVLASETRRSQGGLSWRASDKVQQEVQQKLRSAMFVKVSNQADIFSQETKMICRAASINFSGYAQPMPLRARGMLDAASVSTESPIQGNQESILNATVTYECEKK